MSRSGSQISKPQVGFELNFGTREASPHPFGAAMLKQARELFHRKPGLSDQRSKSPFGQFFKLQLYNHASKKVRWVYTKLCGTTHSGNACSHAPWSDGGAMIFRPSIDTLTHRRDVDGLVSCADRMLGRFFKQSRREGLEEVFYALSKIGTPRALAAALGMCNRFSGFPTNLRKEWPLWHLREQHAHGPNVVMELVETLAMDKDLFTRRGAEDALVHLKDLRAVGPLINVLRVSQEDEIRIAGLRVLAALGTSEGTNAILETLNSGSQSVREAAVLALVQLHNPATEATLVTLLSDRDLTIYTRIRCCLALEWIRHAFTDGEVDQLVSEIVHEINSFVPTMTWTSIPVPTGEWHYEAYSPKEDVRVEDYRWEEKSEYSQCHVLDNAPDSLRMRVAERMSATDRTERRI